MKIEIKILFISIFSLIFFPFQVYGLSYFYILSMPLLVYGFLYFLKDFFAFRFSSILLILILLLFLRLFYSIITDESSIVQILLLIKGMVTISLLRGIIEIVSKIQIDDLNKLADSFKYVSLALVIGIISFLIMYGPGEFNFYRFTVPLFQYLTGGNIDGYIDTRILMRNTVSEIFVLFLFISIVLSQRLSKNILSVFIFSITAFLSFSRKATLEMILGAYFYTIIRNRNIALVTLFGFLILTLYFIIFGDTNIRQFQFSIDNTRIFQYLYVITNNPYEILSGNGIGALVGDQIVHNLYINELYRTGLIGFLSSIFLLSILIIDFLKNLFKKNTFSIFLIIPILSTMVSSTYEFFFTPAACVAVGLFYGLKAKASPN